MTDIFDPNQYKEVKIEINQNKMSKGDELNLAAKDPTLQRIHIGVGWDQNQFDTEPWTWILAALCWIGRARRASTRISFLQ